MSLETERILLESKVNKLRRDRESKLIEGEMFVNQVRNELSPYLEFAEIDLDKARVAFQKIVQCRTEIDEIGKEIKALERKLK